MEFMWHVCRAHVDKRELLMHYFYQNKFSLIRIMRWGYRIVLLVQFYGLGFIHSRPNWWMIEIKAIAQWLEVQFSSN